jgi:hypothetical protein
MFSDFSVKEDQNYVKSTHFIYWKTATNQKLTRKCVTSTPSSETIKLHDHIVAQMTERAIENNQEMKILLSGIKPLS